jgi:uncharacterized protein YuzE
MGENGEERHPEVARHEELVRDAVARPEMILAGKRGELKAIKHVRTNLGDKVLVVVFRQEPSRKDIITAYFTSDLKRIKGEVIWRALVMKPRKLDVDYDERNDVLYISVGKPREADDSIEPQEGVVMRTRKGELVGITIIGLRNRFPR